MGKTAEQSNEITIKPAILELLKTARTLTRQIKILKSLNCSDEERAKIKNMLCEIQKAIDIYKI